MTTATTLASFRAALLKDLEKYGMDPYFIDVFVTEVFRIVEQKRQLDGIRDRQEEHARSVASLNKDRRNMLKLLRKALKPVTEAEAVETAAQNAHFELVRVLTAHQTKQALEHAIKSIEESIENDSKLTPGVLKWDDRENAGHAFPIFSEYSLGPGVAEVDHWFVVEINRVFDACFSGTLGKDVPELFIEGRDQIVVRIFKIAFDKRVTIDRVKKIRQRKPRQPRFK